MSATSRVAGAIAAGYLLGRFKKLRLAILVGSAMSSPKFRSAAVGMIEDRLLGGAVVGTLTKEVGGKLVNAGNTAATSIVASRIDSLSQNLADRSQNLRKGTPDETGKSQEAEEPEDEYEEQEGDEEQEGGEEPEDEYEEQEGDEEPEDEYEEQEGDEEPEDEYEEQEGDEEQEGGEAKEPEDQKAQADEDASRDEEPEEPVVRSSRRRRSASPAGRRRA